MALFKCGGINELKDCVNLYTRSATSFSEPQPSYTLDKNYRVIILRYENRDTFTESGNWKKKVVIRTSGYYVMTKTNVYFDVKSGTHFGNSVSEGANAGLDIWAFE